MDDLTLELSALAQEDLVDLAKALRGRPTPRLVERGLLELVRRFFLHSEAPLPGCGAPGLAILRGLAAGHGWDDASRLIDRIALGVPDEFTHCHPTPRFRIHYDVSGENAVDTDGSAAEVEVPYTAEPLARLPADASVPTYVRRLGCYLEHAFDVFLDHFDLGDPATAGAITVMIQKAHATAGPLAIAVPPRMNDAHLYAWASHELFHVFQFFASPRIGAPAPGPSGLGWWKALFEGGAVFAEDATSDPMNRYLLEAGNVFNGAGLLAAPDQVLASSEYKAAFFWRYFTEQSSTTLDPDWKAYSRAVRAIGSDWSSERLEASLESEAGLSTLRCFRFSRIDDATTSDVISSQTLLGNFALACYMKDLVLFESRDRRFDMAENTDDPDFYIAITGTDTIPRPSPVKLSGPWRLAPDGATFEATISPFARCFLVLDVDAMLEALDVRFAGDAALAGASVFHVVELADHRVRDIVRWDAADVRRRIRVGSGDDRLRTIAFVISSHKLSQSSSVPFAISVSHAPASPDVMVTPWNCRPATEYELPLSTATWTSPDVTVGGGELVAGVDNEISVTIHNRGAIDATGVTVALECQPGPRAALRHGGWQPAADASGHPSQSTPAVIPARGQGSARLAWAPPAALAGREVGLRVRVVAPDDPNMDNKIALSMLTCRPASP